MGRVRLHLLSPFLSAGVAMILNLLPVVPDQFHQLVQCVELQLVLVVPAGVLLILTSNYIRDTHLIV